MKYYPETRIRVVKNITRHDGRSSTRAGWQMRIERCHKHYTRFFADVVYGSRRRSFNAAAKHLDALIEVHGVAVYSADRLHTPEAKRAQWLSYTRTGVKGIGFTMCLNGHSGERVPTVLAFWPVRGARYGQTSFSIKKYGLKNALRMATNTLWVERTRSGALPPDEPQIMFNTALRRIVKLAEVGVWP